HMLPRANSVGRTNLQWLTGIDRPQEIRYQPVSRPVAASNDIACPGAGNRDTLLRQKGAAICRCHDLGTRLAARIGVMSSQGLIFPIRPDPFPILIALVCRHI